MKNQDRNRKSQSIRVNEDWVSAPPRPQRVQSRHPQSSYVSRRPKPHRSPYRRRQSSPQLSSVPRSPPMSVDGLCTLAGTMLGHDIKHAKRVIHQGAYAMLTKDGRKIPIDVCTTVSQRNHSLMSGRLPIPPRLTVKTRFQNTQKQLFAGSIFMNQRWIPTFCYDIDPNIGSTAMPFFSEIMTLYRFYRTLKSKISVHFGSLEGGFNVNAWICPCNFDPTTNVASYQKFLSNPLCKTAILGSALGESTKTITHHATTDGFAGSRWNGMSDAYTALGSGGAPSNNWWWAVGLVTDNAAGFANGVSTYITIDVTFVAFEEGTPPA